MSGDSIVRVQLQQNEGFEFQIHFAEHLPALIADEPPPLGKGNGPTPAQLLIAGVANCLSDSLTFALGKYKQQAGPLRTEAEATIGRNEDNRLRILAIRVQLHRAVAASEVEHLDRILSQFEGFCTVSESVRQGIPVDIAVFDSTGAQLK